MILKCVFCGGFDSTGCDEDSSRLGLEEIARAKLGTKGLVQAPAAIIERSAILLSLTLANEA